MSNESENLGTIAWLDLTVPNADQVRDFYVSVAGWKPEPVAMGDYNDYNMLSPEGTPVAGVCHARGVNLGLPAQWMIYIMVADLDTSVTSCRNLGGKIIREPTKMGPMGRYAVISDPAGAVAALFEKAK